MKLNYNINYDICATLFLLVIYIYLNVQYSQTNKTNRLFRTTVLMGTILSFMDTITAISISNGSIVPPWANTILNTMYFMVMGAVFFFMMLYLRSYMNDRAPNHKNAKLLWIMVDLPLAIYYLLLIINLFTGCAFYFDEAGEYVHGSWFHVTRIVPIYFLAHIIILVSVYRKHLNRNYMFALLLSVLMVTLTTALQLLVLPDTLLSNMGIAIGLLVMLLSLETPEYQRIVDTMEELNQAKNEAQEANKAKSRFLATMSHEIRTPINGVLGMNTMILKQKDLSPSVRECALNIQSSGKGLLSIINDILDLTKIENGDLELVTEKYELHSLINEAYQMVFFRAKEKQLELKVQIDPSLPLNLYGDETRVRQIVVNLLTNAVKYTHTGTVTWRINWEKTDEENITLIFEVQDTGIGIAKEDLKNLFKAFQRIDTKKNRNIEGTGLGLRITRQLVDLMDGKIDVESTYGQGSTFRVSIPQKIVNWEAVGLYKPHPEETMDEMQVDFTAPDAYILAVDDVSMNLRVLRGLLKNTQIAIDTATSGVETLEKITKNHYDLIFLDHMMPGMNGVETLHNMQSLADNLCKDTPVIMLTANAIVGAKEEYLKEGFHDYLTKPIQEQLLRQMILEYLPKEKIRT